MDSPDASALPGFTQTDVTGEMKDSIQKLIDATTTQELLGKGKDIQTRFGQPRSQNIL